MCAVNLLLKVFQTDPVCFCFKSNVLGSDQAYLRVRFRYKFQSWKQEGSPLVIQVFPLWLMYVYSDKWYVYIQSSFQRDLLYYIYSFRCEILMCSSFSFYSKFLSFYFSSSNLFLLTVWGSILGFLTSNTGLSIVVENSSVEFSRAVTVGIRAIGLVITLALWRNSIEMGLVIP